jgi:hypothetical protein
MSQCSSKDSIKEEKRSNWSPEDCQAHTHPSFPCHLRRIRLNAVHDRRSSGTILAWSLLDHLSWKPGSSTVFPPTFVRFSAKNSCSSCAHFQRSVNIPSKKRPDSYCQELAIHKERRWLTIVLGLILAARKDNRLHVVSKQLKPLLSMRQVAVWKRRTLS